MKEKPRKGERGEDFRTLPASVSQRENALLDFLSGLYPRTAGNGPADSWRMRTKQRGFPSWGQQASATARAFTTWPAALQRPFSLIRPSRAPEIPMICFAIFARARKTRACSFCFVGD